MFASLLRPHIQGKNQSIFFQEEARAERQANLLRISYMIIWLLATTPGLLLSGPTGSLANIGVGFVWLLFGLGYHVYLQRIPYHPFQKYFSTTVDIVATVMILFLYHLDMGYSTSLKAPPFMNLLLALSLSAFRFNIRLPLYGSILAIVMYVGMALYMVATQNVEFGTPLELFTTPKINLVYQFYRVAYLLTEALLLVILVKNVDRLVRVRVAEAENAFREKERREHTQQTMERYFTPEIAQYLLDHPPSMGGSLIPATVMFSDVRGFTALSESLDPTETVQLLNTLFAHLTRIVFKYQGTLDKFLGDGMLVVFGTPEPHEDDALRAVQAAQEMVATVQQLRDTDGLDLEIGIAIHSGEIIFGNIGSPQRMELTVIGDTVNTTSRIESLNKEFETTILLSHTTVEQINGSVPVKKLASRQLRGKQEEITLYTIDSNGS